MNQLGYYGKVIHRGDFVRFNLPQSFIKVWDDWLQQILIAGERKFENWTSIYAQSPTYRFVLSSGITGNDVWIGVVTPSTDKVGRKFPFCLAMSLGQDALPCLSASANIPWFNDAQTLLRRLLNRDYDFDLLQGELSALADRYAHYTQALTNPLQSHPLHSDENRAVGDTLVLSVASDAVLSSAHSCSVLLDAALTQTLGEYSVWMCSGSDPITSINAGLPVDTAGLALFTTDRSSTMGIHVPATDLIKAINAASPDSDNDADQTDIPILSAVVPKQTKAEYDDASASNSTVLNQDIADQIAPGLQDTQTPTPDDWAALEENISSQQEHLEVPLPEVEPLELDEDDVSDAPWEKP